MLLSSLYHPPFIEVDEAKTDEDYLYLNHRFEGKPLVREYIPNTLLGIEYLWGAPVKLETTEVIEETRMPLQTSFYHAPSMMKEEEHAKKKYQFQRVVYTMEKRELSKVII
jgi:stage V sporulation protein R